MPPPLLWDLYCRVVDNHGDLGVCWRLARELGARGHAVRLWCDDDSALAWMAPQGAPGVQALPWAAGAAAEPGDVVVEAFACDPPAAFVARMAARARAGAAPPAWINLEYLSAEDWVERCHGLPSPQGAGPGRGLVKHFFHPGFTAATGGLLREPGLLERRAAFARSAWLAARGIAPQAGERVVVLFCYPHAPLPLLWRALAGTPTLLLATPGPAQALAAHQPPPAGVRVHALPWLAHDEFDALLWSADLNLVRGEDSAVRAIWAGAPFVWQFYAQHDGAHAAKLEAYLARVAAVAPDAATADLRAWWRAWNALPTAAPDPGLPPVAPWRRGCAAWRDHLAAQPDLTTQLLAWLAARTPPPAGPPSG